jgi:hypothetical protein
MKSLALLLGLLGLVGCTHGLVWEPTEQVTLPGGLAVRWRSLRPAGAVRKPVPLVVAFQSVGAGPVVLCRVVHPTAVGGPRDVLFVRRPESGRFRYDAARDSVAAQSAGGSPFSLTPAFAWYDQVLYPGSEGVTVNLGEVSPGAKVRVLVEYLPLSYRRLSAAGYAQSVGAPGGEEKEEVTFARLAEESLRQRQPRALFLRTEFLPPPTRVPLEIPWGSPGK